MQFLVIVNVDPEKANHPPHAELVDVESQAVRALYMSEVLRQIRVRQDGTGAFMIVEARVTQGRMGTRSPQSQ